MLIGEDEMREQRGRSQRGKEKGRSLCILKDVRVTFLLLRMLGFLKIWV